MHGSWPERNMKNKNFMERNAKHVPISLKTCFVMHCAPQEKQQFEDMHIK